MDAALKDRIGAAVLQSMAASLRAGVGFSFNPIDMAELLESLALRITPKLAVVRADDANS